MDIEWTKPVETYGELKGYRVMYGHRGQKLTEILVSNVPFQHRSCPTDAACMLGLDHRPERAASGDLRAGEGY